MKEKNISTNSFSYCQSKFSHVYVEKDILNHKNTKNILDKLKKNKLIIIDNYKEVFNRPRQNFSIQKQSPNLIIARKKKDFYYRGSENCESFGEEYFYYTSFMFNCIYQCDYCYLQGMYTSANIVIFVNLEDYFWELNKINKQIYLCLSYDSDILAIEKLTGLTAQFIEYLNNKKNILTEIRTKSGNFSSIADKKINENIIFAWSVLPQEVIEKYERYTPSLDVRIKSIKKAIDKGLKVRLSMEPIIKINEFEKIYSNFVKYIFKEIPVEKIRDINIGTLRYSKDHYRKMKEIRKLSPVFGYDMFKKGNTVQYKNADELLKFILNEVKKYYDNVYF